MPAKKSNVEATEEKPEPKAAPKSPESDRNLMAALAEFFSLLIVIPVLIYLVKKEDRFVKFHALQATVVGVVFDTLGFIVSIGLGVLTFFIGGVGGLCGMFVFLLGGLVALYLAYMAYTGSMYKLPLIGDFVEKYV